MKGMIRTVLLTGLLAVGLPAVAQPEAQTSLQLDADMEAFEDQELSLGPVTVVASYRPIDFEADIQEDNLQLDLYYQGQLRESVTETAHMFGSVDLEDLDSDGNPEVVLQTYTGGAHCCMAITTYTWQNDQFQSIVFDYLDAGGGIFEDLDDDGLTEFVTLDNAFFYTFSSYAGSYPPSVILTFQDGAYIDTTTQFRQRLGSTAWDMYQSVEERDDEGYEINGLLAGYVAQKIRLGQYQEGWDFMLARYERDNDWGLQIYDNDGNVVKEYENFPSALEAFLQELGYLDTNGNPQPGVDRSPVVPARMR